MMDFINVLQDGGVELYPFRNLESVTEIFEFLRKSLGSFRYWVVIIINWLDPVFR